MPTHLQCAKHQNKPLVRKASESKDVCPEMHTKGSGSYKEPSSKFRNERTSTCNSIRGFSEPSFFLTECDFCNTVFQIFPVKCLMNTVGAIIPAEMTRPPSEVPVPGLLQAPRSSQRVSFEQHSLHCCGRARGQLDGWQLKSRHTAASKPSRREGKAKGNCQGGKVSSQKPKMTFIEEEISLL